MSLRPQPDMKEGACIAANGEEASILMLAVDVGSTVRTSSS
jgi:hypothetical protein